MTKTALDRMLVDGVLPPSRANKAGWMSCWGTRAINVRKR